MLVLAIDSIDIMTHLKKDERSHMHKAVTERNAAWFMVLVLAVGMAFIVATQ